MPVKFTGGTSGDKYDYLPDVSRPFDRQEPQDTSGGNCGTNLQLSQNTANARWNPNEAAKPGDPGLQNPPVPECATPDDSAV